jgi:hypothetical protein
MRCVLLDSRAVRARGLFQTDNMPRELGNGRGTQVANHDLLFRAANVETWMSMAANRRAERDLAARPIVVREARPVPAERRPERVLRQGAGDRIVERDGERRARRTNRPLAGACRPITRVQTQSILDTPPPRKPLTRPCSGVSVPRTRARIVMPKDSTPSTTFTQSLPPGDRVFADDEGRLWSATHAGEVTIFTCISDGRHSARAIVANLATTETSVGDDTLRAWLEAAPRIGTLP